MAIPLAVYYKHHLQHVVHKLKNTVKFSDCYFFQHGASVLQPMPIIFASLLALINQHIGERTPTQALDDRDYLFVFYDIMKPRAIAGINWLEQRNTITKEAK